MPNPVTASPTDTNWLQDAPGADVPFDQLFGADPERSVTANTETQTTTTSAESSQQVAASPQDQRPPETGATQWQPIRARTGTVYNTYEDTVKGIEEKDSLIAQLRDQLRTVTGQDPVQAQRHPAPQPVSYLSNPSKYAEDLAEAARKGDARRYMEIQVQLQDEYITPYKPLLQELARTTARSKVQTEVKDFDTFIGSNDYATILETSPALKLAIGAAEQDLRYAGQLNELYRLAYDSYVARVKLPKLIEAAQTTQAAPATQQVVRPSVTATTLQPGAPTTAATNEELMRSQQGRKELIERFKAQGLDNIRF